MKKRFVSLFLAFLVVACGPQAPKAPPEFPLYKGTSWVYTYQTYEQSETGGISVVKATYQLTETVLDTETAAPYFVAHLKRTWKLLNADVGWTDDMASSQNAETWYVTSGEKVYSSNQALDVNNIKVDELSLAYDFPLAVNKNWCPMQVDPKDPAHKPMPNCQYSGEREVTTQTAFESVAGKFNQCYGMIDRFNDGSILQTFCVGVGIVSMKFDHAGTPFGFEQTLSGYASGTP